jgi:arabinogalactan endo-1,4-beta-galactosidase
MVTDGISDAKRIAIMIGALRSGNMTIDELITWCEEEEQSHRIKCKRADDASGYTRSKNKNIRTAVAIREEVYGDFYKQTADTMRKYQKIVDIVSLNGEEFKQCGLKELKEILEVIADGRN